MKRTEMIVERTNTGYSAYAKDYPVGTTGDTLPKLTDNIIEAMNFYFEEMGEGKMITEKDLKISLD